MEAKGGKRGEVEAFMGQSWTFENLKINQADLGKGLEGKMGDGWGRR